MKYKLRIRKLTANDLNKVCPFLPDEDFDCLFEALKHDIEGFEPVVLNVKRDVQNLIIEIDYSDENDAKFHEFLKTLLGEYFDKLRAEAPPHRLEG